MQVKLTPSQPAVSDPVSGTSTPTRVRTRMKTTTLISNDGGAVVLHPPSAPGDLPARGTDAVDVTRAKLTRQLAERTNIKMQVSRNPAFFWLIE